MTYSRKPALNVGIILTITAFSCSLPMFKSVNQINGGEKNTSQKSSKLSGVLLMQDGCDVGYYQIKMQGLLENANVQVESQTDSSGHFSIVAPPGKYMMSVSKENCGSKESIDLLENTEHMISVSVHEVKAFEKNSQDWGRVPASILIPMKK